jgi:hypothetical protein
VFKVSNYHKNIGVGIFRICDYNERVPHPPFTICIVNFILSFHDPTMKAQNRVSHDEINAIRCFKTFENTFCKIPNGKLQGKPSISRTRDGWHYIQKHYLERKVLLVDTL